jgi:hypothetical protein
MNWDLLFKALPLVGKILREIIEGQKRGATNQEIRDRIASPDVILDEEMDELRDAEADLDDFVRTGG